MCKLISHKLGDLIINLFLSLFNSTKCGVVFFYVFSMPFHLPCRILLSFRFVASHVHRSCQFASYASFLLHLARVWTTENSEVRF